jgi:hypothetical protein
MSAGVKYKAVCFNNSESNGSLSNYSSQPSISTRSNHLQVNTKSYTPNTSGRLAEIKNEESYLEQIKQKLDMHLKETENLKAEMARSKQQAFHPTESIYRASLCTPSYVPVAGSRAG